MFVHDRVFKVVANESHAQWHSDRTQGPPRGPSRDSVGRGRREEEEEGGEESKEEGKEGGQCFSDSRHT